MHQRSVRRRWIATWTCSSVIVLAIAVVVGLWAATESETEIAILLGVSTALILGSLVLLTFLFLREDYLDYLDDLNYLDHLNYLEDIRESQLH